jgi:hypothetical protein
VIDTQHWKVDETATTSLRAELRARRPDTSLPIVDRSGRNGD